MTIALIEKHINEHEAVIKKISAHKKVLILKMSEMIASTLDNKGTVFWMGNGGSSSDSMHISAELIGRFNKNRRPLSSIALSTDSAALTCIANDYGFEHIFSRQIEALGRENDCVVGISTSGMSINILNGINSAKRKGIKTIGLLGKGGGGVQEICDLSIVVDSNSTARIQEVHITLGHILCDLIEKKLKLNS